MNIRPRAGETLCPDKPELPLSQARFARPVSCRADARARARPAPALARPRNTRAMSIDPRRRADIIAAVNAYNSANPGARLPRNAALLLAVMFGSDDTCQRSQEDLAAEGV